MTGGVAAQAHHAGEVAHITSTPAAGELTDKAPGARTPVCMLCHTTYGVLQMYTTGCVHTHTQTHMHIHVYTHMHTQAPLAAKESEGADKLRRYTSQLEAKAQVFMRLRTCTHTHAHAHARAYVLALVHVHVHVHI